MEKLNEFMEKVKTDEALQKELAEIIGDSGAELTKEQKEKIAGLAAKLGIELDVEGELSDEELGNIVGGLDVAWVPFPPLSPPSTFEWEADTYRCKNCGKTKKVSLAKSGYWGLENDCPVGVLGRHEYEKIE